MASESITLRIDMPVVNQQMTDYVYLRFRSGDQVTIVDAGGCVQTGGSGNTWKRYVNPDPTNMYYGTVQMPGFPVSAVRDVINHTFQIPGAFDVPWLRLGYVDDDFHDNGYYSHDDGTGNQCKDVGNAYLVLKIVWIG